MLALLWRVSTYTSEQRSDLACAGGEEVRIQAPATWARIAGAQVEYVEQFVFSAAGGFGAAVVDPELMPDEEENQGGARARLCGAIEPGNTHRRHARSLHICCFPLSRAAILPRCY